MVLLCLILVLPASARELTVTPGAAYAFAQKLYEQQDFQAAATEFDRFVHFFEKDKRAPAAAFYAGLARFSMQHYQEAIDAFNRLIRSYPGSKQALEARFMISRCYQKQNDIDSSTMELRQIIRQETDPKVRDRARSQLAWVLLEAGDISRARSSFLAISDKNQDHYNVEAIVSSLDDPGEMKHKSPLTAGLLSAVPGGGYLYTGRFREAGVAFFLTSALAVASWQCFDEDLPALGALTGLAGLGFYSGSIAGGVSSAHKYNYRQSEKFIRRLKDTHGPAVSLQLRPGGAMLAIHCAF
ncbi:MAG: tetratricopeptide repeat protein [Desulfobacteraceae bacterium]|nr:tetratricopeptide repeat protein [Desulfobacteraceae bacterium]